MSLPLLVALAGRLVREPLACFTVRTPGTLGLPTARNQNARFGERLISGAPSGSILATGPSSAWSSSAACMACVAWPSAGPLFGRARASPRRRAAAGSR